MSERLSKLVLMLSSPVDGEVLAAARAIGRELVAQGKDWHWVAGRLAAGDVPKANGSGVWPGGGIWGRAQPGGPAWQPRGAGRGRPKERTFDEAMEDALSEAQQNNGVTATTPDERALANSIIHSWKMGQINLSQNEQDFLYTVSRSERMTRRQRDWLMKLGVRATA